MSLSERSPASYPDELTPATQRRFQLWRAMSDLSKAQADGRLAPEQVRLLEALADNLQQLAAQMSQLADLGKQYSQAIEAIKQPPAGENAPHPQNPSAESL